MAACPPTRPAPPLTSPPTQTASASPSTGGRAGFTEFIDHDGRRIFPHTVIDKEFGGRGLATILVREALDATRAAGLRIVAVCPMVVGFVEKHPEYAEAVDPVTTDIKRLLARR